ncbi:helix-turn-helix transcriptional regulator [Corynebacterium kutscheri]|uniref:helix-turn-helix transcriptional regulator n=1 Tax=Corynebacterium kutscheri TaxID=35755 RepID=UPI0037BE98A5
MNPTITDTDTGRILWRSIDCANHAGITTSTWRTYVSTGNAPAQVASLGARMPLWDAEEVKTWQASRPGSPVTNSPKAQK